MTYIDIIKKTIYLCIIISYASVVLNFPAASQTISADLMFRIKCEEGKHVISNDNWSQFLIQRGFSVLDKVRLARDRGQKALLPQDLVALDAFDRIIELRRLPFGTPYPYIALRSPPPTHHDGVLEADLIAFASEAPGCQAIEIARHNNDASKRILHDSLTAMVKGWFRSLKGI